MLEKQYHSFACVISQDEVVFQHIGTDDEPSVFEGAVGKNDIKVSSKTLSGGNEGRIWINGIDYSVNKRGLNFVVINDENGDVIDSVNFDTHVSELLCIRMQHG